MTWSDELSETSQETYWNIRDLEYRVEIDFNFDIEEVESQPEEEKVSEQEE